MTAERQIVVVVRLIGSLSEDIFILGFVQSLMSVGEGNERSSGHADAMASSAFFASMHAPLLWTTMSAAGSCIVVLAALVVGCIAALARKETGSLLHPIMLHLTGNAVAGVAASLMLVSR